MKPDEKRLERLLKRIVKGEAIASGDLLFHWTGLGKLGDRVMIRLLNRSNGWEAFLRWAGKEPILLRELERLGELAAVPDSAVKLLRSVGLSVVEEGTARQKAESIRRSALGSVSQNQTESYELLANEPDLLDGVVDLLEDSATIEAATFLTTLLEARKLDKPQEDLVRKSVYRLKQKGIFPVQRKETPVFRIEANRVQHAVFFENRIPLWQTIFYYNSLGGAGDFFLINLREGREFESNHYPDAKLNLKRIQALASEHSSSLEKEFGIAFPLHVVFPEHARYFLNRSLKLLEGMPSEAQMERFLRYLPEVRPEEIVLEAEPEMDHTRTEKLFAHDYFINWFLEDARFETIFQELEDLEKGPIILPELQMRERTRGAVLDHYRKYFDSQTRSLWAHALEKAAFFLREADPELSRIAAGCCFELRSDRDLDAIAFAMILFERSLERLRHRKEHEEKEEKQSSLIMSPQEFQQQYQKRRS